MKNKLNNPPQIAGAHQMRVIVYYPSPVIKSASCRLLLLSMLFVTMMVCVSCGDDPVEPPQVAFDKANWAKKEDGKYPHRKQMIKDLLTNYKWTGLSKDSVITMLGKEDSREEGHLTYYYESKPFLGGLGTTIEAVVFELAPDSTVKVARLNDGGWD